MKLDEWQMWKNNSKNERRKMKTISRRREPQATEISESEDRASSSSRTIALTPPIPAISLFFNQLYGVPIPEGPLEISDLLPLLLPLRDRPVQGLEIMLYKWKPDGSYLSSALEYIEENWQYFQICHIPEGKGSWSIFQLIDVKVSTDEKLPLAIRCLEIDFKRAQDKDLATLYIYYPEWMCLWRKACALQSWEVVKECASRISSEVGWPGPLFTNTALHFLGEKRLESLLEALERLRAQGALTSALETEAFEPYLFEAIDILSSFKEHEAFNIDISCYQRVLQLDQWVQKQHSIHENRRSNQLGQFQKKFLQLKTLHASADRSEDMMQNLLGAADRELSHIN
jgi:hypothetical protein